MGEGRSQRSGPRESVASWEREQHECEEVWKVVEKEIMEKEEARKESG